MAELREGWAVLPAHDFFEFGPDIRDYDDEESVAMPCEVSFFLEEEGLVILGISEGAHVSRRLLFSRSELLDALRLAGILDP